MSALALSRSEEDDGFPTCAELLRLRLTCNLLVLSACDVGRGSVREGEGYMGMVRTAMCAGAPRVLASLWAADDEASSFLMQRFHAHRRAGMSDAAALHKAQEETRGHRDKAGKQHWRHAYYWAGWVLWGMPK